MAECHQPHTLWEYAFLKIQLILNQTETKTRKNEQTFQSTKQLDNFHYVFLKTKNVYGWITSQSYSNIKLTFYQEKFPSTILVCAMSVCFVRKIIDFKSNVSTSNKSLSQWKNYIFVVMGTHMYRYFRPFLGCTKNLMKNNRSCNVQKVLECYCGIFYSCWRKEMVHRLQELCWEWHQSCTDFTALTNKKHRFKSTWRVFNNMDISTSKLIKNVHPTSSTRQTHIQFLCFEMICRLRSPIRKFANQTANLRERFCDIYATMTAIAKYKTFFGSSFVCHYTFNESKHNSIFNIRFSI